MNFNDMHRHATAIGAIESLVILQSSLAQAIAACAASLELVASFSRDCAGFSSDTRESLRSCLRSVGTLISLMETMVVALSTSCAKIADTADRLIDQQPATGLYWSVRVAASRGKALSALGYEIVRKYDEAFAYAQTVGSADAGPVSTARLTALASECRLLEEQFRSQQIALTTSGV